MISPSYDIIFLTTISLICSILFMFLMLETYAWEAYNKRKDIKLPLFLKKHYYKSYVKLIVKNNKQVREYIKAYGYPWEKK